MPFIPAERVAEVEIRFSLDGQHCENTLYFERSATIDSDGLQALATAIETWWAAEIAPSLSANVHLVAVVATDLTSDSGPQYELTPSSPVSGGNSSPQLPNNVAWCIKFLTGFRGRSFRGRNYISGLTTGHRDTNNTITVDVANTFKTSYESLLMGGGLLPEDWLWVVLSRYHANAPRVAGVWETVISVSYTDLILDSQRKRLPGRGL